MLVAFWNDHTKIRQLAVDEAFRGKGAGRELMLRAEQAARPRGMGAVVLHGRVTARGFFEKLGYRAVSGVFIEVTIPHISLEKAISPEG